MDSHFHLLKVLKTNLYHYLNQGHQLVYFYFYSLLPFLQLLDTPTYFIVEQKRDEIISRVPHKKIYIDIISKKTASILNKPEGINLQNQELFYYPLIYWPLINTNIKLSSEELKKINSFLKDGGLSVAVFQDTQP